MRSWVQSNFIFHDLLTARFSGAPGRVASEEADSMKSISSKVAVSLVSLLLIFLTPETEVISPLFETLNLMGVLCPMMMDYVVCS